MFKEILNKSNLLTSLPLMILIFFFSGNLSYSRPETNNTAVEAILVNKTVNVGDTISIKIKRIKDEKRPPKVFFNKTKIPSFMLSDSWYRSLAPLSANFEAGEYTVEVFYEGGVKRVPITVKPTEYPFEELTLTKEVAALQASKIEKASVAQALSTESNTKFWSGEFMFPSTARKSTVYGVKRKINGVINHDYFHKGLDFAAPTDSIVKAPENGKVVLVGRTSKGFVVNGNCIFLDHGHGVLTAYLHLNSVLVKEGDLVKKGQVIGKVGSTGIASGPHLHWGLYVLGKTVDPLQWTSTVIE